MSQENVEIVRRGFEAFNRGGPEAMISGGFWSPEIVWDTSPSGIPGLGIYRGQDEVKSAFENDWFKAFPFEEWEIAVEELIDHGDQVIAMSSQRGRGASSGVAAELEQAHVFTLRDGKVVRIDSYLDREKALEAAGLREQAMSRENVEIIEEGWRAINRGDVDTLLGLMADDVDLRPPSHLLDGIVFRGHAGIRAWMERITETWRELEGSPREVATVGEHVVMAIDVRLIGRESGVPVNQRVFVVYTLREGKCAAMIAYPGERDALEAAGLSE